MKFAVGVARGGRLVGVATIGRTVARVLDDRVTVEVTRTCTLGDPGANSMLYGAAWRADRKTGGIARTRWEIRTHEVTVSAVSPLLMNEGAEAA